MLFVEGSRVKLKHTGHEGVITAFLEADMAEVLLDGDDSEIPVFLSDLIRIDHEHASANPVKAKSVPAKQPKGEQAPVYPEIASQYAILKSMGIQIAFDPIESSEGITSSYDIYVLNDTRYGVVYHFALSIKTELMIEVDNKLDQLSAQKIGSLAFDSLSSNPQIELEIRQLTTEGQGVPLSKNFKIKPKQFFKKSLTAPILNRKVFLYQVFESFDAPEKPKEEDLRSYTERNTVAPSDSDFYYSTVDPYNVTAFANFSNELDLHIEKIRANHQKINKDSILKIQLETFDEFMNEAIRVGATQLFVIHGIGKGKLKGEIAKRLEQTVEVKSFKNEFHPRYGWGATEILL